MLPFSGYLHPHFFFSDGETYTLIDPWSTFLLSLSNHFHNKNLLTKLAYKCSLIFFFKACTLLLITNDSPAPLKLSWLVKSCTLRAERPLEVVHNKQGEAMFRPLVSDVRADSHGVEVTLVQGICYSTSLRNSGFDCVWF